MWSSESTLQLGLLFIPTAAMFLGSAIASRLTSPKWISALQHTAAGILLGTVSCEMIPSIQKDAESSSLAFCSGFLLALGFLFVIARYDFRHWRQCYHRDLSQEMDSVSSLINSKNEGQDHIPKGLISAILLDGAIDGLLVSLSQVGSFKMGLFTSLAISLEMGLLSVSYTQTLQCLFESRPRFKLLIFLLPLAVPISGFVGMVLFQFLPGSDWHIGLMAFGCGGMLFLVTEELLVKAHVNEEADTWYVSMTCSLGFLLIYMVSGYIAS